MKFSLYTDHGALNSKPVFDAFESSVRSAGHSVMHNEPYRFMGHYDNYDVAVIWSVLWNGRMAKNQQVWDINRKLNKPVIVLEVGSIKRGITWKVGLNGVNRDAYFAPKGNNSDRARLLGLELQPWKNNQDGSIIICTQHTKSQQWENMPSLPIWILETVSEIRNHTDRQIILRTHPRCPLPYIEYEFKNVVKQIPIKLRNTYDDFNFDCGQAYAVVNWSSNPGIEAVLSGIPAFVGPSSLAFDVGNHSFETINDPVKPDRTQWLNDYAHTEYTLKEIADGIPLKNLTPYLY
jgi:hypothetical protein